MPPTSTSARQATVFLAHSSLDIKEARRVRNLFEERNHDVLLLKLSQRMTEEYLRELLVREIQARDWLVMLRSAHADRSSWVGFERHFAENRHKPVFEIDLAACAHLSDSECLHFLATQVGKISRCIRVFLSYSRQDSGDLSERLARDLEAKGFEVWLDKDQLHGGDLWVEQTTQAIDKTLERGALVLLMSKTSLRSVFVRNEVRHALGRKGRVIPCLVHRDTDAVPPELRTFHWINFSPSYQRGLSELVHALNSPPQPAPDSAA
jgi:hypothetical protein